MAGFSMIQGGMGVGVSNWHLARAVSLRGQLGVVSGTGLAVLVARRLQVGDLDGSMRRAIAHFPSRAIGERVLQRYFVPGGISAEAPFALSPVPTLEENAAFTELTVVANFVEVFLAKEGHDGVVGINYLEKIQIPLLPSLMGAMLAGVDYVLIGAGIPRSIPGALDAFAQGKDFELKLDVDGVAGEEAFFTRFSPSEFFDGNPPAVKRPMFFAIVSSATLAMTLARKSNGKVDGFVVEGPTAGGHNAPPRGPTQLTAIGEPIYGPRDNAELGKIAAIGLPFYLAGGFASPDMIASAIKQGASGVQIGTAFAFCDESGITPELKREVIKLSGEGSIKVFTDPAASPTGFPFKVVSVPGTVSEAGIYENRKRICDLGYLRQPYRRSDGEVGFRCPAEPINTFARKDGDPAKTLGRKCICNALFATIGLGQIDRNGETEPAIVTAGDDVVNLSRFVKPGHNSYTADEVIDYLLGAISSQPPHAT